MKKLLFSVTKKNLKIDHFSGSGAGGQYRNKHQNCIRLHHPDSGTIVTGQSNRERRSNMREAFNNLVKHPKFKMWHCRKIHEINAGKTIEQLVSDQMESKNIKIEGKNKSGQWRELAV
jgi:hypothetical protein